MGESPACAAAVLSAERALEQTLCRGYPTEELSE